jgi:hypothetical protein
MASDKPASLPRASNRRSASREADAERLVGLGFRYWVAGYQAGDIDFWEEAWRIYANALGPRSAKTAVSELSAWVRAVSASARREIEVVSGAEGSFSRDECLAVSMIAACQHNTCPAMKACAFALIESSLIDEVVHHAGSFAITMRGLDQVLSPGLIVNAAALAAEPRMDLRQ